MSGGLRPSARRLHLEDSDELTKKDYVAHLHDMLGDEYAAEQNKDRSGIGFKKPEHQLSPPTRPMPPAGPYVQPAEEQTYNEPNLWSLGADLLQNSSVTVGLGEGRCTQLWASARTRLGPRFLSAVRLPLLVMGGALLGALIGFGAKLAMNTGGSAEEADSSVLVAPLAQLQSELAPTEQSGTTISPAIETLTRAAPRQPARKVFTVDELPSAPATEDEVAR